LIKNCASISFDIQITASIAAALAVGVYVNVYFNLAFHDPAREEAHGTAKAVGESPLFSFPDAICP
jgi:hypothetical protein